MKIYSVLLLGSLLCQALESGAQAPPAFNPGAVLNCTPLKDVSVGGYFGKKIDLCISNRISAQNGTDLVKPFFERKETKLWQSEFWGKWMLSAIAAYQYHPDQQLKQNIAASVKSILSTQTKDGYIGNYAENAHLQRWDVWGRKYTMLGLLAWYDLTGAQHILKATCKLADHLLTELGPGKADIVTAGLYRGMPSSSILEPMVLLYNRTKDQRYLTFAKYIVGRWESPDGPGLISKAVANIPVANRFPQPAYWWSWENGGKAYEMMSCYDGLLELYAVTRDPSYLKAVELVVADIAATEINAAGGASSYECWYHGADRQTEQAYNMMETCVTQTWMKLCAKLLTLTGKPVYADYIEISYYNALQAAMSADGATFAKYTSLSGQRNLGDHQCGMDINCCIANGPRAIMLVPAIATMTSVREIFVNIYQQSTTKITLNAGNTVEIVQETDYPKTGLITFTLSPIVTDNFALNLRIPVWSKVSKITVNEATYPVTAGTYAHIYRRWKAGDKVVLHLDMKGRVYTCKNAVAIMRGPVLLARDARLQPHLSVDDEGVPVRQQNEINLQELKHEKPDDCWLTFSAPFQMGNTIEGAIQPEPISFCDFASSGNTWNNVSRFRAWIQRPINIAAAN